MVPSAFPVQSLSGTSSLLFSLPVELLVAFAGDENSKESVRECFDDPCARSNCYPCREPRAGYERLELRCCFIPAARKGKPRFALWLRPGRQRFQKAPP